MTDRNEYEQLKHRLQELDQRYYAEPDKPQKATDQDYDQLRQRVLTIEQQHPEWMTDSPTQRVGSDLTTGFNKCAHVTPMLSLDNIFNDQDLQRRLELIQKEFPGEVLYWTVEPKVDGVSLDLRYEQGRLTQALTRGDGECGDIVTRNMPFIQHVPEALMGKVPDVLHVRGEVYIGWSDFHDINKGRAQLGMEVFATPRNAAAGGLKQTNPEECKRRRLQFIPYRMAAPVLLDATIGQSNQQEPGVCRHSQVMRWLLQIGFSSAAELMSHQVEFDQLESRSEVVSHVIRFGATRTSLDIPTDGAVVKVGNLRVQEQLGAGSRSVKWAYAYKYEAESAITRLRAVTFQVGRTGVVTPVAELEPVELAGTTVSRASLHNDRRMAELGVQINDLVRIYKAGEIIPQVAGVAVESQNRTPIQVPSLCPSCQSELQSIVLQDEETGVAKVCNNHLLCQDQIVARLEHWCSKTAMNIMSLGPVTIQALVKYRVRDVASLYTLSELDLRMATGFSLDRARQLHAEIQASKQAGLERVMVGLGISGIGALTARKLANNYATIWDLLNDSEASLRRVLNVKTAKHLQSWYTTTVAKALLLNLSRAGVNLNSTSFNATTNKGVFDKHTVVFTGVLETLEREDAQRIVQDRGGRATTSVSKKTTLVVAGREAGSKLNKARELNIPVLSEAQFLRMRDGDTLEAVQTTENL